jgi:hypothetical protein
MDQRRGSLICIESMTQRLALRSWQPWALKFVLTQPPWPAYRPAAFITVAGNFYVVILQPLQRLTAALCSIGGSAREIHAGTLALAGARGAETH